MKSRTVGHNNYATYKFQIRTLYEKQSYLQTHLKQKMKTCTCRPDKFLNSHVPCSCTGKEEGGLIKTDLLPSDLFEYIKKKIVNNWHLYYTCIHIMGNLCGL